MKYYDRAGEIRADDRIANRIEHDLRALFFVKKFFERGRMSDDGGDCLRKNNLSMQCVGK